MELKLTLDATAIEVITDAIAKLNKRVDALEAPKQPVGHKHGWDTGWIDSKGVTFAGAYKHAPVHREFVGGWLDGKKRLVSTRLCEYLVETSNASGGRWAYTYRLVGDKFQLVDCVAF